MMTGTPAPNAPTDVWALCRLVKPETVPTYFTQFKMMTMLQLSTYKWIPKHDAYDTAYRVMQPAIRFRLEDCVDLPPTTVIRKECELSPEQLKAYKAMTQHYAMQTDSGEVITAANAAVRLSKLIQIGLGGAYGADGEVHEIPATSRLEVLKESIEEAGAKVIVFVPFRSALQAVVKYLRQFWSVEYVDGTVSATKRAEIFKNFQQAADPHILVAHPKTAAHGLTLVAADTIVWYGPIFSNELYQQANARIVRTGQTRHTNIIELCASEVEKEAYALVKTKEGRQQKILSLYANVFDKH
jgi:SNF2 family DNA or RNA helicase